MNSASYTPRPAPREGDREGSGTAPPAAVAVAPGVDHFPGFLDRAAQAALRDEVMAILDARAALSPAHAAHRQAVFGMHEQLRRARLGLRRSAAIAIRPTHPETGRPWPATPQSLLAAWGRIAPGAPPPEACLINLYDSRARMGLHQDRDEEELAAPVVSLSLGDTALFRVGGLQRNAPTRSFRLASGDAMALRDAGRLAFHGVDRIIAGSSTLLPQGGRINLTLRRVTRASVPERRYLPLEAGSCLGAAFGPPLETPTIAGLKTRSPIVQPLCTTWETVPAGTVSSGASKIAW